MKWLDLPPIWLAGFVALAWVQAQYYPFGLNFGGALADLAGGLLVGGGLVLMALMALVTGIAISDALFYGYFIYALTKIAVWMTVLGFTQIGRAHV